MTAFPKEAIKEILQSLDHANDALWTDDGSPLVTEIQRLANDKTITRAQINEAFPGFARKSGESVAETEQPADEAEPEVEAKNTTIAPATDVLAEDEVELSDEQEQERLRAIALSRVTDAEKAISDAKEDVARAVSAVAAAEQRHTRALLLFSSKYPPLSAAENIQQHIKRQQEVLRERVTGSRFEPNSVLNPVDARMMDRKRDNGRNNQVKSATKFLPRSLAVSG